MMNISPKTLERLQAACDAGEVYTLAEVLELLNTDGWEIWERPDCVAVTLLEQHQIGMVVDVVLAGGELSALQELEKELAEYGRSLGCKMMYINGRPGWQRALQGYSVHTVTIRRPL